MVITFVGMIHKLIGFDKALEMKKDIGMNFVIVTFAFLFIAGVLNVVEKCEAEETKYEQKKLRIMKQKEISAKEIQSIVKSLKEGICVVQNQKMIY